MNTIAWIESALTDLRYALRDLRKHPSFTAIAVLMLAAGIGVNVMVFSVVNAVLFKGYPGVRENNRLVYMTSFEGCCVSYPDFLDWREGARSFQGMEITHGIQARLGNENPERYDATELSAGAFRLVGRQPILGRDFSRADEVDGSPPVAILQYDFWRRRFNGDPRVIGSKVTINRSPTTIIGVMPEGFLFPQKNEMWLPLVKTANAMKRDNRQTWMVIGRLKDGVTIGAARAEVRAIAERLARMYPETNKGVPAFVETYTEFLWGRNSTLLYAALWGAVGFVLLIACANVANLMLARAVNRSREISLRMALGASRVRVIRKLLLESLLVAATGGVFGLAIARLGLALFVSSASRSAWMSWIASDYSLDRQALFYAIALSACTGLLFGIAPAFVLATEDFATAVKDGARGAAGTKHGRRFSSLLVVTETALAVVLLAGAGVMVRSFLKLYNADIGIDTDHVLSFNLEWPDSKRLPPTEEGVFYDGLLADLDAIPGIESVSLVRPLPSETAGPQPYEIDGEPGLRATAGRVLIAPSYFHTVGTSILAGREFSSTDRAAAQPVALVNERFASQYFPSQSALGKRIRLAGRNWGSGTATPPWRIIVGVVSNIKQNMAEPGFLPLVYFPYLSNEERGVNVIARTQGRPERLIAAIRLKVQKANPALTVWRLESLKATLHNGYWKSQFYGTLFLSFAAVALLLAATGLYAVMALEVSRRTREIGVRIAIGGSAGAVSGLVLRQAMAPVVIGLAAGLAVSFATNRVLQGQLVQVSPSDPLTMALTALALLAAALAGCAVPALRAVGIDPTVTLRNE